MAEEGDPAQGQHAASLTAAFPDPPPFYKHFTPENLARFKQLQNTSQHQLHSSPPSQIEPISQQTPPKSPIPNVDSLPSELRYLVPPLPPSSGTYHSFGDQFRLDDTLPTLAEEGIDQLYPSSPSHAATPSANDPATHSEDHAPGTSPTWTLDRAFYLKKIAKSLLLNFVELIGVLSVDPAQYARKIEDLRTLFVNAHHLLNEYRPHQARETLILMMKEQIERGRQETVDMKRMKEKVENVLAGLESDVGDVVGGGVDRDADKEGGRSRDDEGKSERIRADSEERRVWEVLEREFGSR